MVEMKKDLVITFLIGNGFDLGLGLKTRFKDFYIKYLKDISTNKNILEFKKEIAGNIESWSDFEYQLGQYSKNFDENNWRNFLDSKENFENAFFEYLKNEQEKIIYDKNQIIAYFYNAFNIQNLTNHIPAIFTDFLEEEIENSDMLIYKFINFNYTNTLEKIIGIIKGHQNELARLHRGDNDFDSNNPLFYSIQHVHGSLKDLNCLIGVDNKAQIANESLTDIADILEYMLKPEMNKVLQTGNEERAKQAMVESDIIFTYGLSLGVTDNRWWIELIENATKMGKKIIFFIHDDNLKINNVRQEIEQKNKYLTKLAQIIEQEQPYLKDYNDNIGFVFNKDIFAFNLTETVESYLKETNMHKLIQNTTKNAG